MAAIDAAGDAGMSALMKMQEAQQNKYMLQQTMASMQAAKTAHMAAMVNIENNKLQSATSIKYG